jgi:hypothetical protein
MEPRDRGTRLADTLIKLETYAADAWVATAGADGPYLVPLSLAWIDERVVIALPVASRTARNLLAGGTARLGVGPTRDVVLLDVVLERWAPVAEAGELADRYAAQADWEPRAAGGGYCYLVLRPERVQAWRDEAEHADRTLMRDGAWLR